MAQRKFLIDTSALARIGNPSVIERWGDLLGSGMIGVCPITELEFRFSARSVEDAERRRTWLADIFTWYSVPDTVWRRTEEVQIELLRQGKQRSAGAVDLLLAATAEFHDLTVLHYDSDFETIASITGQPTQWIAPRGSVS